MLNAVLARGLAATITIALMSGPLLAREITHAMGITDVPDNPQRIVVIGRAHV